MPGDQIRLLALDGGGVRGLSSLMILRKLMEMVNSDLPPRPCDYFDMIGGTSTGGIIAIMLGRLRMSVDECIEAYTSLSGEVFTSAGGGLEMNDGFRDRFDATKLVEIIKQILRRRGLDDDLLLKEVGNSVYTPCKVFVCATSKQTSSTVCLASYNSPRSGHSDLWNLTTVWQACRATSAAPAFFEPVSIGPFDEEFVDGGFGRNNPINVLWNEAQDTWGADALQRKLQCIVSIGTGVPDPTAFGDDRRGIMDTLVNLTTDTENTAQQFHRDNESLHSQKRYFRFNVDRGLRGVGLEEAKKKSVIAAATRSYVSSPAVYQQMQDCARSLQVLVETRSPVGAHGVVRRPMLMGTHDFFEMPSRTGSESHVGRHYNGSYRTAFTLEGVPASEHFVARVGDTAEIEECLLPQRLSRPQQDQRRKIFVIYGLGGIGKTQLAADFARRHKNTFSSIFWLDSRSEDRLRQSLASCARRIPQGQIPEISRTSRLDSAGALSAVVADVLDWLTQPDNTDWLLIFDNVDLDEEQGGTTSTFDVQKYIPGDHGSVLITTRLSKVAQLGKSKELGNADEALSKAVYEEWYGGDLVLDAAGKKLLEHLGGLPLALAQAATYCRETGLDVAAYVELYDKHWNDLFDPEVGSGSQLAGYDRCVATTWTISLEAIEKKNEAAANLLRLWAMMSNKDLWYELLLNASTGVKMLPAWLLERISGQEILPDWLLKVACNKATFSNTMRLLRQYSMVEATSPGDKQDTHQGVYNLHPVVHKWASHLQDAYSKRENLRLVMIVLALSSPVVLEYKTWAICRRLLPHAEMCYRWEKDGKVVESRGLGDILLIESFQCVAHIFNITYRFPEAQAMYEWALRGKEKVLGLDDITTLTTAQNLGSTYLRCGRLTKAEVLCQRTLQGFEKAKGPADIKTLHAAHALGLIYREQNRPSEAEAMFHRALHGDYKLRSEHQFMVTALLDLCTFYRLQGRLPEAEKMSMQALQSAEKVHGPDHMLTLGVVVELGALYSDQGRLPEAKDTLLRALKSLESSVGLDSIFVYSTCNLLGDVYLQEGRLPKAEAMSLRALAGYEKIDGSDHISTLYSVTNLGLVYFGQDRLSEAETMFLRALAGYEKIYGSDHIDTLQTVANLGVVYINDGRLSEAATRFQQALEGFKNLCGPDDEYTRRAASDLSECRKRLQQSETEVVSQTELEEVDNEPGSSRASASASELFSATNGSAGHDQVLLPETEFERNKSLGENTSLLPEEAEKRTKRRRLAQCSEKAHPELGKRG